MTGPPTRLATDYFQAIYDRDPDPWGFETRWYEKRKYALTLASLPSERYARAFEPGCSHGVLTSLLADRCDRLIAADVVTDVVDRARERLAGRTNVEVRTGAIPEGWPAGRFDLIVLSEVAYYLNERGLREVIDRVDGSLDVGGHLVAVHWTGDTDYPLTGAEVHARFDRHESLRRLLVHRDAQFVLAVYERKPAA